MKVMRMNVLSRIGILAFASLLMLTSCKKDAPDNNSGTNSGANSGAGAPKYLVKEIITDGSTMKIEYDSQNRASKLASYYSTSSSGRVYEDVLRLRYEGNRVKVTGEGIELNGALERGIVFLSSVASEKDLPPVSSGSHSETPSMLNYYIEGSAKLNAEGKLISYDTFMYDDDKRKFEKIIYNLTWKDGNLIAKSSSLGVETFEYSDTPNLFNYFDGLAVSYGIENAPIPSLSASVALHSKNLPKRYIKKGTDISLDYVLDNLGRPNSVEMKGKDGYILTTFKY